MELQGKNVEKLPNDVKVKMEETLVDMEEIRKEDTIQLRQKALQKIQWLKEQHNNAIEVENKLSGQLEQVQSNKLRIDGALTVLQQLVEDK